VFARTAEEEAAVGRTAAAGAHIAAAAVRIAEEAVGRIPEEERAAPDTSVAVRIGEAVAVAAARDSAASAEAALAGLLRLVSPFRRRTGTLFARAEHHARIGGKSS